MNTDSTENCAAVQRLAGTAQVTSRCAPSVLRTSLALLALTTVWLALSVPPVLSTGAICDDVTWAKRSLSAWWFPYARVVDPAWPEEAGAHQQNHQWTNDRYREYHYAIDHPSVTRIVYGAVLTATGARSLKLDDWDFSAPQSVNSEMGRVLPERQRIALRLVNVAFVLGMLILVYVSFVRMGGNRLLALGGAVLMAFEPCLTIPNMGAVVYIGSDSIFLFFFVLAWFVWLRTADKGLMGAVATGAAAGLAAATKLSGGFTVAAVVVYWALYSRGAQRAYCAAAAGLTAAVVFLLFNPVCWGGPEWVLQSISDTLQRRAFVKHEHLVTASMQRLSPGELLFAMLPQVYLFVPFAIIVAVWRRAWWFRTTAFWSLSFACCNVLLLYMYLAKYAAPVRVACSTLVLGAVIETVGRAWRENRGPAGRAARAARTEPSAASRGDRQCPE